MQKLESRTSFYLLNWKTMLSTIFVKKKKSKPKHKKNVKINFHKCDLLHGTAQPTRASAHPEPRELSVITPHSPLYIHGPFLALSLKLSIFPAISIILLYLFFSICYKINPKMGIENLAEKTQILIRSRLCNPNFIFKPLSDSPDSNYRCVWLSWLLGIPNNFC